MRKKQLLILLLLAIFSESRSSVINRSVNGALVHWPNTQASIPIYYNINSSANTGGVARSIQKSMITDSVAQWNGHSSISVAAVEAYGAPSPNRNDLYFSDSSYYFSGTGVVAITTSTYDQSTGEIYESDIIINNTFVYSATMTSKSYLGNIITHEVGHFLGLGHGQVKNSSMFYTLLVGQHSIEEDERSGLFSLYPNSIMGSLRGSIRGGDNIGIFAARVEAISLKSGKVAGATISDPDGSFIIDGLNLEDSYYIYTSPAKRVESTLPNYYASARNDFCPGNTSFVGSFFQSCLAGEIGYPEAIKLTSLTRSKNIGTVSVRCSVDAPVEYMNNKGSSTALSLIDSNNHIGEGMSGYFSPADIINNTSDSLTLDLSNYSASSSDEYLSVRVVSAALYSPIVLEMLVTYSDSSTSQYPVNTDWQGVAKDSDGAPFQDFVAYLPISTTAALNTYSLDITPTSAAVFASRTSLDINDFFPDSDHFLKNIGHYLLIITHTKKEENGTYTVLSSKNAINLQGNNSCLDAPLAYSVKASTADAYSYKALKKRDSVASCAGATIGIDHGGPPSGPGATALVFALGLGLALVFGRGKNPLSL